ncbi:MAG: M48 family metalloprotease [Phycisphaerae bacterium]|nr:M48 family metalloprotease [Phycisphaerae bacterium]
MKSCLRVVSIVLLVCVLFAAGCTINPVTGKKQLTFIPEHQEIALGVRTAPQFEKEFGGKVDNLELQEYVAEVGAKLAAVSDREMPYEFALLSSDVPNAFALPGGKIYITAGLFANMTNERQLAAVLAHETVHVAGMHSVQGLQRQMGAAIVAELIGVAVGGEHAESAEAATKLVAGLRNLKHSREDESQADEYGLKYMYQAAYNPWGMVELLELLQSLSQSKPGLFGDFLATHPLTSRRIEDVRDIIAQDYSAYSPQTPDPHGQHFKQMRGLLESVTKE